MTERPGINAECSSDPEWDRAVDAAAAWSVRLQDDPEDAALRAEIEEWIARAPIHAEAWEHMLRVSGMLAQTKGLSFLPSAAKAAEQYAPSDRKAARPRIGALPAVAAAAILAWVAAPSVLLHLSADHITSTAEQRVVTLEDGSTVRIAPESAISVAYSGNGREVRLLSGEAYFEVTPDRSRPFRVEAKAVKVAVLGTKFDVRLGEGGADVSVREGRVQVAGGAGDPAPSIVLTRGQWRHVAWDGPVRSGSLSPSSVGRWSGTRLTAIDRPLSEVLADARRYHDGAIILTDAKLGTRSVTGSYDMRDPVAAIAAIVQPHGGTVRQITPWLLIVSRP